ncbi:MAG: TrbI/VirB10 family protein [Chthoniobacteraceae bacterium]
MSPRSAINFFRSRTGAFLLFLILLGIGYVVVNGLNAPSKRLLPSEGRKQNAKPEQKPQTVETVTRDMTAFNPPKEPPPLATPAPQTPKKKQEEAPKLPPISLYAAAPEVDDAAEALGKDYAPFGRLVQCELIVTVDSSAISTPIIGLVTDDVWHDGRLVIPAGTEVHGTAKVDRVRERIASSGNWTLVWQGGDELSVSGLALDREKQPDGTGWGITDGSAGLRGALLKSDDLAEIKLFAATFLSGAASGLTEKEQTVFGSQAVPSLQNAPFVGAQQVLAAYAKQILDTIQRDGFYVRVPAGKQFYLYVTQTLDRSKAVIGGTRVSAASAKAAEEDNLNDPLFRLRKNLQRLTVPAEVPATLKASAPQASSTAPSQSLFR